MTATGTVRAFDLEQFPDRLEIIKGLDLPALIRELIPSCRQAGGELSGLCPFHEDQNPSISVNP